MRRPKLNIDAANDNLFLRAASDLLYIVDYAVETNVFFFSKSLFLFIISQSRRARARNTYGGSAKTYGIC